MKIAICVSGVPRSGIGEFETSNQDFLRNAKSHAKAFPTGDFYYATWKNYESTVNRYFGNNEVHYFEEPQIKYHPFYDIHEDLLWSERLKNIIPKYKSIKDNRQNRYKHQTKQILCHAYLLDYFDIKNNYDIIVRLRYDTYIYEKANISEILKNVCRDKNAVGFGLLKNHNFQEKKVIPKNDKNGYRFLFDAMIIHSSKVFDTKSVYNLHNQKRLLPCEFGWFQTMSMPYGENHVCISGWANADRTIPKKLLI